MKLIEFQQQAEIPDYLKSKSGLASQVLFIAVFALLFINIYQPFSAKILDKTGELVYVLWSFPIVFIGFAVLVVSRILLFYYSQHHRVFYWIYAVWIAAEISVIALIYTVLTYYIPVLNSLANFEDGNRVLEFFGKTFKYIFWILFIPTTLSWTYLAFVKKKKLLQELEQKLMAQGEGAVLQSNQPSVLQFCDEKGEPKFSVKAESVIWIESADNYVVIKYQNQDKISDFLLRNSLRRLEEEFKDTTLLRCHRSYMVNLNHAVALRRGSEGFALELDVKPPTEIPVSKTYKEQTTEAFMQFQQKM